MRDLWLVAPLPPSSPPLPLLCWVLPCVTPTVFQINTNCKSRLSGEIMASHLALEKSQKPSCLHCCHLKADLKGQSLSSPGQTLRALRDWGELKLLSWLRGGRKKVSGKVMAALSKTLSRLWLLSGWLCLCRWFSCIRKGHRWSFYQSVVHLFVGSNA